MPTRRDILRWGGAALATGVAGAALPRDGFGRVQPTPRRLLVVLAGGGWDTCYALDPKEAADVDIPAGVVRRFAELDVFTDVTRPKVSAFFEKYGEVASIVRGISTDAINHAECQTRIVTGSRESTSPDVCAIVAHELGRRLPVPYLILGETAFTGPFAVDAARVGGNNQLTALLDEAGAPAPGAVRGPSDQEAELLRRYVQASAERARAVRGAHGYNRRRVDDFAEAMERSDRLRKLRGLGGPGETQTLPAQIDVALEALQQDLSHAVMLNTRLPWDTHAENFRQTEAHETTFGELTRLMDELMVRPGRSAGTRMIDDTVVVCMSELSRTPRLYEGGKGHWPVTSAVVMGAGCVGGVVVGATAADAQAVPIDLATGRPSPGGIVPMYSHLCAGLLALCGVDPQAYFEVPAFDAFVA